MYKTIVFFLLSTIFIFSFQFTFANCDRDDWTGLKALYDSTNGDNWTNQTGWDMYIANQLIPPNNCDLNTLYGVKTTNGRVTCIDLDGEENCWHSYKDGNNLDGILPTELEKLNHLKHLSLANNTLNGKIPSELGDLKNLISYNLHNNQLTGSIPPEIGKLTNLEFLALSYNKLDGSIPSELNSLTNLKEFYIKRNNLTGCYPDYLRQFCSIASNADVSNENQFDANWEDFCETETGACCHLEEIKQCHIDDWTALKALYDSTNGDSWFNITGWDKQIANQTCPPANCNLNDLYGIELDDAGRVSCIDMDGEVDCFYSYNDGNNLDGILPSELGKLNYLTYLNLKDNQLSGSLPPEIGSLIRLRELFLNNNQLSGNLPIQLGNLTNLVWLFLSYNQFEGNVPAELGNLTNLEILVLDNNRFSGSLPAEIGGLTKLRELFLYNNQLSDNLPTELGNLTELVWLYLGNNQLNGSLPTELGDLTNLEILSLGENRLSGNFPAQLSKLTNLKQLFLNNNQFNGSLPAELGDLTNLVWLFLSYNQFDGSLPAEICQLTNLTILSIRENNLQYCYPACMDALCGQLNDQYFYGNYDISDGNNFDAPWEEFCTNEQGACPPYEHVPTNYSGYVSLTLDNDQNILKNEVAIIYDYSECSNNADIDNCIPVSGYENKSANEALWAVTKAAEYLTTHYNIELPVVAIIVNNTNEPNRAYFHPTENVIELGAGDGIERNSMSAPDVIAHEYLHFLQHNLVDFFAPLANAGEPGALRESIADIFGEIIEHYCYDENDWIFASQVMIPESGVYGIRSLSNPNDESMKYECPNTYLQENFWVEIGPNCDLNLNDRCGIHTNCGVHNYWFYVLANNIGLEAATDIVFKNFTEHLDSTSTYKDAAIGSIKASEELYGNISTQQNKVIEAWDEVGISLDELDIDLNFIQWTLEVDTIIFGNKTDEVTIDLVIDSVGQYISADGLDLTLHLDQMHQGLTEDDFTIHGPLNASEVEIEINPQDININIDRNPTGNSQESEVSIKSGERILSFLVCIPVADGGEKFCYPTMQVSGHTIIDSTQLINFRSDILYFGSCREVDSDDSPDGAEGFSFIYTALDITPINCSTLGTAKINVLHVDVDDNKSYTYKLFSNRMLIKYINSFESSYLFDGLNEGSYTVELEDNNNGKATVEFEIKFVAETEVINCCPVNLIIPPGNIRGSFNADTISFEMGTFVPEGEFEMCDQ